MGSLLDFKTVLVKKNRTLKQEQKKIKEEKIMSYSGHFNERCAERKVSQNLINTCIKKGRIENRNGAVHYILENFHVVVDSIHEGTLITAYFKKNEKDKEIFGEVA